MKLLQAVTVAALLAGSAAHADTLTIDAGAQGWISSTGISNGSGSTSNMYTGIDNGHRYNSWAAFKIPPGQYSFASLSFNPVAYGPYDAQKIGIFDVTLPMGSLLDGHHPGAAAYADLGSGAQYGSVTLFDLAKSANLSGAAVFDINAAAGGYLLIGFSNLTMNALPMDSEPGAIYLGGFGRGQIPLQLNLEVSAVPEPGSWAMLGGGLALLACVARRRNKQST